MALTKVQRKVMLVIGADGIIRRHIKPDGKKCWRLLDNTYRPIRNIKDVTINRLIRKEYLQRTSEGIKASERLHISATGKVFMLKNHAS